MVDKEIRLIYGTLALIAGYVGVNVLYRTLAPKLQPPTPEMRTLVARGQQLAESCAACHYLDQRANFVGPQLVGLVGRPVGDSSKYEYSSALKKIGGTWTPERLSEFLSNPQAFAPGTKMAVKGWSQEDVRAIVAYLQSKD